MDHGLCIAFEMRTVLTVRQDVGSNYWLTRNVGKHEGDGKENDGDKGRESPTSVYRLVIGHYRASNTPQGSSQQR